MSDIDYNLDDNQCSSDDEFLLSEAEKKKRFIANQLELWREQTKILDGDCNPSSDNWKRLRQMKNDPLKLVVR